MPKIILCIHDITLIREKGNIDWTGELALVRECLLGKREDLHLGPQHQDQSWSRNWEAEMGGSLEFTG